MSTSICDFSASGPSFHGDVLTGAGSGPCEAAAGDSAPGASAFGQAFAKKLADLAAQRSPSGGSETCDGSQAGAEASAEASVRQKLAAQIAPAALDGDDGVEESTTGTQLSPALSALTADGTDPGAWAAQAAVAAVAAVSGLQTAGILGASQAPSSASGLTTVAVSPGLNVIQPAQSELDGQSLVAFARAQGLDDRAVQWLFGQEVKTQDGAQEPTSPGVSGPVAAAGSTSALATAALNAVSLTSVSQPLGAGSSPQAAVAMAAQSQAQAQAQLMAQAEGAAQGTQSRNTQGLLTPQALAAQAAQAVQSAMASGVNAQNGSPAVTGGVAGGVTGGMTAGAAGGSATQAQQAVQALNWLRDAAAGGSAALWGGATPHASINASMPGRGAMSSPADPLAAIFNVSKSLLIQNQRAGATSASSTASARATAPGARVTHATLDLVSSLDPELVEWLEVRATASASSGPAARLKNSNAGSTSFEGGAARVLAQWAKSDPSIPAADASSAIGPSGSPPGSPSGSPFGSTAPSSLATTSAAARTLQSGLEGQLAHAQDRAQRLADRLGEAVGQRILTELEKGNWHLNLKLRPESLGSIDIEMRMQAGQLNAQFTAHQALTRDLISDGLNRLKDTLAQMGMNVAQMNVNGGRSQQRGGDSTPRSSQGVRAPEATSNNQEADATTPSLRPSLRSGSGWDMLV